MNTKTADFGSCDLYGRVPKDTELTRKIRDWAESVPVNVEEAARNLEIRTGGTEVGIDSARAIFRHVFDDDVDEHGRPRVGEVHVWVQVHAYRQKK